MTTARLRTARDSPESFETKTEGNALVIMNKPQFSKIVQTNQLVMIIRPWPAPAVLENIDARAKGIL